LIRQQDSRGFQSEKSIKCSLEKEKLKYKKQ